jgi:8-oxo-dGTP pyrophosphatase MutT (NUDIX family)
VRREIAEETGLKDIQIDFIVDTLHFYRGERRVENEMLSVAFCCTTDQPDAVQISAEHSECRWLTADEMQAFLPPGSRIVESVRRAETIRRLAPKELLALYQSRYASAD